MMLGGKLRIKPGDWVTYRMTASVGDKAIVARMEVLVKISVPIHADAEHPLEPDQFWIEFEFRDPTEETNSMLALKILVKGDPREAGSIQRMILKAGQRMPMEISKEILAEAGKPDSPCDSGDEKGCAASGGKIRKWQAKRIYTNKGWMKARRVRIVYKGGRAVHEFWTSDQVPLFGVVRAKIEKVLEMELEGFGQGALSRIDETRAVPMPDIEELEQQLQDRTH